MLSRPRLLLRRGLLRLRLRLLLRWRLLLPPGRKMVPNRAASSRAQHAVMAGNVAGDGPDGGTFDAAFGVGSG